jgi:hypothetical protein
MKDVWEEATVLTSRARMKFAEGLVQRNHENEKELIKPFSFLFFLVLRFHQPQRTTPAS